MVPPPTGRRQQQTRPSQGLALARGASRRVGPGCTLLGGARRPRSMTAAEPPDRTQPALATFGAGCFWCVEAVLEQLDGVLDVVSGYMGGDVPDPSYRQVCAGTTGHAEVVQVRFDPARISYDKLLDWFWRLHDPTQKDRQGNDVGTQYRSVIFTHDEGQRRAAEESRARLEGAGVHPRPVATQIVPAGPFYRAERGHQGYYRRNVEAGYCRLVIAPKLDRLGLES